MSENPLIAQREDSTTAASGIGIAESAVDLYGGIESGSWSEIALGGVGVGLEALSLAMDPVGTLVQYAVSWLMEHVKPLSDALDWLAGDPDQISAYAESWNNVGKAVGKVGTDFSHEVKNITGSWTGPAADAYKKAATDQAEQIKAASTAANTIGLVTSVVGTLVGIVRELVRDLVAECVSTLIARIPQWIAELGGSLGIATPHVVASATSLIAKWVNRIKDMITKLTRSLEKLQPLLKKLDEIWEAIKNALKGLRTGGGPDAPASTKPSGVDSPTTKPDMPGGDSPDTTKPSGTDGDGSPGSTPDGGNPKSTTDDGNMQGKSDDPETPTKEADNRQCKDDPIDIASGEMIMSQTDVEIAAALPLVLRRTHLSSYRVGLGFGASWSSTLDQRLEVGSAGVSFAAEDGKLLFSPTPAAGTTVEFEGSRNTLTRNVDDSYTVELVAQAQTLHFATDSRVLPLTTISDRNGNRIDFDYDTAGVPTDVRHSGGYRIRIESEDGLITGLHLRGADNGEDLLLMRYEYTDRRLTAVTNASGLPLNFDYDAVGRIVGWTDRNGCWYRYTYNHQGRCVQTEGSGGCLTGSFEYDTANRITRHTNSLGHTTTFHLNDRHQTIREIDPLGGETLSEWDAYDRLLSRTDPLGRTLRVSYDEWGNLTAVTRPDGSQVLIEYNDFRLPITIVAPSGSVSRREYDENGNVTRVLNPVGTMTLYSYDEQGHPSRITDAHGNTRQIEANDAGLPVAITDALGNTTSYARDPFGRVTAITDPLGGTTRFGWTVDGKPAWRTLPDGATERWLYDGEGNLRTHIDALGQTTQTEVTHFDLPAAEIRPDGTRLQFGYDAELQLIDVTNEQGLVWHYDYDPVGNLVRETDFNGRTINYRHDNAGQLLERTNGLGQTTHFTRDILGNVIERRTGNKATTFTYDETGRLLKTLDGDTQVSFQRDPVGRVLAETINGRTVTSAYDALGRRVLRRTPSGAESVWEYDANSRPTALHTADRTVRFDRDASGREIQRTLGADAVLDQDWDANHRLRSQTLTGTAGRHIQQRSYTYRADGFLTGIDDQLTGPRTFDLDQSGRVTVVQGQGWTERYAYDAAGNIAQASWPTPAGSPDTESLGDREYFGTLIRRTGNVRYEHDAQGRVVLRQQRRLSHKPSTWRYFWDADDRLIEVLTPDGARWRYRYDPLGRRIAKQRLTSDGSRLIEQIEFTWDGAVLAEQAHTDGIANGPDLGDARVTAWNYEPGSFRPLTQTERSPLRDAPQQFVDQQFYSIVTDLVGSPSELVNDQGGIAWFYRTTLWGNTLDQSRTGAYTPLRFPGQYADPETGFNYNFHRHYDPATGRYASSDPLGLVAGPNQHRYVSNPLGWTDPLGLSPCPIALGLSEVDGDPLALQEFAERTGSRSYRDWPSQGDDWVNEFQGYLNDGETPIHFNLDGIDDPVDLARHGEGMDPRFDGHATAWELNEIRNTPGAWSRVSWHRGGETEGNPFDNR